MVFMISRETENVQSAADVEQAFRALTTGEKPYITAQELYSVSYTFIYIENRLIMVRNQIENSSGYCSNFDSYLCILSESDPGTSGLLYIPYEAVRGPEVRTHAAGRLRLRHVYTRSVH